MLKIKDVLRKILTFIYEFRFYILVGILIGPIGMLLEHFGIIVYQVSSVNYGVWVAVLLQSLSTPYKTK